MKYISHSSSITCDEKGLFTVKTHNLSAIKVYKKNKLIQHEIWGSNTILRK